MELLMILFFMTVYAILAIIFVAYVRKKTELKLYRWLAAVFVIFLPTWDVVLGYLVYYPASMFIPKVAIYETAETEGIYYEGMNNEVYKGELNYNHKIEEVEYVGGLFLYEWQNEFKYLESMVANRCNDAHACDTGSIARIMPRTYKCIPLLKEDYRYTYTPRRCFKVEKIESPYMVKVSIIKAGIAEINFKKIVDRSSGKLMAEYKRVNLWSCFPFFEWLGWRWWSKSVGSAHCPLPDGRYFTFEYEVLKPLK